MIRKWIKSGAAGVMHQSGMDRLLGSLSGSQNIPVVIGYHRVVEDFARSEHTSIPSLLISRRMFERHVDWIGRRYQFTDLNEIGRCAEEQRSSKRRLAAITFDDGYQDICEHALPVLQRKGIPATVFAVTGLIGTRQLHTHDRLYLLLARRLRRLGRVVWSGAIGVPAPDIASMTPYQATRVLLEALPLSALLQVIRALEDEDDLCDIDLSTFRALSWETLDRVRRAGFTIGSHTKTHVLMTNETPDRLRDEVTGSRAEIQEKLGVAVQHFAYPSGFFDGAAVHAVAAAGYRFGYTTCVHRSKSYPTLTIPRTILWENSCLDAHHAFSGSILSCQISHAFDWVAGCRHHHASRQEAHGV